MYFLKGKESIAITFDIKELLSLRTKEKILKEIRKILFDTLSQGNYYYHHNDGGEESYYFFIEDGELCYIYKDLDTDESKLKVEKVDDFTLISIFEYTPLRWILNNQIREIEEVDYLYLQKGVEIRRIDVDEWVIDSEWMWERAEEFFPNYLEKEFLDENFLYWE